MKIVGVIDLCAGRAVHARGGIRADYAPVPSVAGVAVDGDPLRLARAYIDRFGIEELYVADLDAIGGGAWQCNLIRALTALKVAVWLDAGTSSVECAERAIAVGAARVLVGLETLESYEKLHGICRAITHERVTFSLDLRNGKPIRSTATTIDDEGAETIARRAVNAGAGSLVMIDLARVGVGAGVDISLLQRVRVAVPDVTLLAGGGIRSAGDLQALAEAGCDGALVATALHDGRITAADIDAARNEPGTTNHQPLTTNQSPPGTPPTGRSSPPPPSRWR